MKEKTRFEISARHVAIPQFAAWSQCQTVTASLHFSFDFELHLLSEIYIKNRNASFEDRQVRISARCIPSLHYCHGQRTWASQKVD